MIPRSRIEVMSAPSPERAPGFCRMSAEMAPEVSIGGGGAYGGVMLRRGVPASEGVSGGRRDHCWLCMVEGARRAGWGEAE